jgi:predicted CXXCH cytochrome family protein
MKIKLLTIILFFTCAATAVYALSGRQHNFTERECSLCHYDVKNEPHHIKPTVILACNACHLKIKQNWSHPTDIYPVRSIPAVLPLVDGRVTCITCHYTHPKQNVNFPQNNHLVRQVSRGIEFCMSCHEIDKEKHIGVVNIHPGTFRSKDHSTRIDRMSLACIECHFSHMNSADGFLGTSRWGRFQKGFTHHVGIEYNRISPRNRRNFNPFSMMSKDVKLYGGKIGCGTCHSIYSKERNMLVMNNNGSKLCFQCHAK